MIYVTHVSATEFNVTAPGELFIGSADDSGNHLSEGHAFASRPSALKFAYRFLPVNSEHFYVRVEIYAEDGSLIGAGERTDWTAASSWTDGSVQIAYADVTKKASSIYISFKASSSSSPSYNSDVVMNIGNNKVYSSGCNIGSILYLDTLQMLYE